MSKDIFSILNIFIIISLISICKTQNIITSWNYDKVQMYDIQKIGKILQTQIKEKVTSLPDITAEDIQITKLSIINVQQSLYDSYLNLNNGLFLFTPNKVTIGFNFTYEAEGASASATFDLKINILKIRISNKKEDQTQEVTISMMSNQNDFSIYGISNKELVPKIQSALYKGFVENNILNEHISTKIDVVKYYQDFYSKKKAFSLTTSKFLDSKTVPINLNRFVGFCEDVVGKAENALCYYSGEVKEDKKDKSKAPIGNEKFMNPAGTYNMFINYDLVNSVIAQILEEGLTEKIFDKNSVSKKLSFDFTAASLKIYFDNLNDYSDKDEFKVKITINELTTSNVKFNANFQIGDKADVFSLDIILKLQLKLSLKKNIKLNLCLAKAECSDIQIKTGDIKIKDENKLKELIVEPFDYDKVPLCLDNGNINFRDYYALISNAYLANEGIYIEGNQLYQ